MADYFDGMKSEHKAGIAILGILGSIYLGEKLIKGMSHMRVRLPNGTEVAISREDEAKLEELTPKERLNYLSSLTKS